MAYSDFKGVFEGMDHRIPFQTMRDLGFPECYIATIRIHRDKLEGDTLSPFLFTIFMEPLLRWLSVGNKGYKLTHQSQTPTCTYMTYDDHGYADDISITTRTLENFQLQIKKLHLFDRYTRLELEKTKCEATGALWGYGTPLSRANTSLLRS